MTKEPDKPVWHKSHKDKSVSGIEIRDERGELVNFIVIKHDEVLHDKTSHRIAIKIDNSGKLILPPPQTFDEIIQAKRRHQMLLYGNHSSSSTTTAVRSARPSRPSRPSRTSRAARVARAARAAANQTNPSITTTEPSPIATTLTITPTTPTIATTSSTPANTTASTTATTPTTAPAALTPTTASARTPKELKLLLKSAPPGASVTLPDGTVIRKSRRGGARVGAGRKRSRPLPAAPAGQQHS